MSSAEALVERLREAMEGVTKGEWQVGHNWIFVDPIDPDRNPTHALRNLLRDVPEDELQANVDYIVAAQPENISLVLAEIEALRARSETAERENTRLRAALAQSDQPCAYCSLPAEEWNKCQQGFPGCGRADDAMGCPELGASLRATAAEAARDDALAEIERMIPKYVAYEYLESPAGREMAEARVSVLEKALDPFSKAVAHAAETGQRPHDFVIIEDFHTAGRALQPHPGTGESDG